jgi:hypothetical protein
MACWRPTETAKELGLDGNLYRFALARDRRPPRCMRWLLERVPLDGGEITRYG